MGTGKTTLGRALASDLDIQFCDLDQFIEQRHMKTVSQIFQQYGEQEFRRMESRLLHEAGEFEDVVIACGGSTPLFFDNMEYMNAQGDTVFVDASVPVLFRRLAVARRQRPLIAEKDDAQLLEYINAELERRTPYYAKAKYRYSGDRLESVEQVADTVAGVKRLLGL